LLQSAHEKLHASIAEQGAAAAAAAAVDAHTRVGGRRSDQSVGDFMNAKCSQQFANLSAETYVSTDVRVYMQKRRKPTD